MGYDIKLYDPNFPPPDPQDKETLDGMGAQIQEQYCANRGAILGLASAGTTLAGPVGLYSSLYAASIANLNCDTPPPPPGDPGVPYIPGQGGQCRTTYRATFYRYRRDQEPPVEYGQVVGPLNFTGPLSQRSTSTTDPFGDVDTRVSLLDGSQNEITGITYREVGKYLDPDGKLKTSTGYGYVHIVSMERVDGQPDSCGNMAPIGGGDSPKPETPQTPPSYYYAPYNFQGQIFYTPIEIGPFNVNVNAGPFNLSVNINGAPIDIGFDGRVNISGGSTNSYYTDYTTDPPTTTDTKDEDKKANGTLIEETSYDMLTYNCKGDEVLQKVRTGSILPLLLEAVIDLNDSDQKRFGLQCKVPKDPTSPQLLGGFTAEPTEEILQITGISKEVVLLQVRVTQVSSNLQVYRNSVSLGVSQGRYGVASIGMTLDGTTTYGDNQSQYQDTGYYLLPDIEVDSYTFRFSGVDGCSYQVYDSGLRR